MENPLQDRRIKKSKKAIINAMLDLLNEKHYDQISVHDIVERADVGRSTFYVHFENKDDLLQKGFDQILEHLVEQLQIGEQNQPLSFEITSLFEHAAGHYDLYRTLTWGTGINVISNHSLLFLTDKIEALMQQKQLEMKVSTPKALVSYTLAGNLLLLLKWWLDEKMPCSPQEMNVYFQAVVLPGLSNTIQG